MSIVGDSVRILNEEPEIFAFLPAINFVYIIIVVESYTQTLVGLFIAALIASTSLYNFLSNASIEDQMQSSELDGQDSTSGKPRNQTEEGEEAGFNTRSLVVFAILGSVWLFTFVDSLAKLQLMLSSGPIWPEILISISLLFVFLLLTDLVLYFALTTYTDEDV